MLNNLLFDDIIMLALKEDLGTGDITTLSTVSEDKCLEGRFIAKSEGIVCGLFVVKRVFELVDSEVALTVLKKDGEKVAKGEIIATIYGKAASILSGERTALNFLQRLSAIATKTATYAELLKESKTKIADTRKTTPGLRVLEKYAVKMGGGANHRFNLSDGILIKDNHIAAAGGITNAVNHARAYAPHMVKIEVEVENLNMVQEALAVKADVIMLDNMSLEQMREAVALINGKALVEASGNMEEKNILDIAGTGVDIISMGGLTHSVKAMDISLRFN